MHVQNAILSMIKRAIMERYSDCKDLGALAAELGISVSALRIRAHRLGCRNNKQHQKCPEAEQRRIKARQLREDGYPVSLIVQVLGVSQVTVNKYLKVKK